MLDLRRVVQLQRKLPQSPAKSFQEPVLATHAIQPDRDASRGSAVIDVKSAEHVRDHDRPSRVGSDRGRHGYALTQPLMRPALVEVPLVLT